MYHELSRCSFVVEPRFSSELEGKATYVSRGYKHIDNLSFFFLQTYNPVSYHFTQRIVLPGILKASKYGLSDIQREIQRNHPEESSQVRKLKLEMT